MTEESCVKLLSLQQNLERILFFEQKAFGKEIFSLKFKILLLIFTHKSISPSQIKYEMSIAKSNVAMFCKTLIKEEKIEYIEDKKDRRAIRYNLTKSGEQYVKSRLYEFSKIFENTFGATELVKIEKGANILSENLKGRE